MIWGVLAIILAGCIFDNDESSSDDARTPERTDAGADLPPPPPADAGADVQDATPDAGDPCVRDGFALVSSPSYSEGACSIRDIYIKDNEMVGVCAPALNRIFTAEIDPDSPMSAMPAVMRDRLSTTIAGLDGSSVPSFVQKLAPDSFFALSTMDTSPPQSVASLITPSGGLREALFRPFTSDGTGYEPQAIFSGFVEGGAAYLSAMNSADGGRGIVFSVPIHPSNYLDLSRIGNPAETSGWRPVAMTQLDAGAVAVLNGSCDGDNPCIDLIDFSDPDFPQVTATIPLGIPDVSTDSHRLAKTSDNRYIVVASPSSGELSIVDTEERMEMGRIPVVTDPLTNPARFVAVNGEKAYVSSTDRIYIVDIGDPADPRFEQEICIRRDLGPIAVHSSGKIFVAVTDWCGMDEDSATTWNNMVVVDPDSTEPCPIEPSLDGGMSDMGSDMGPVE